MESRTTVEHYVRPWGRKGSDCAIEVKRTYEIKTHKCDEVIAKAYGPAFVEDGQYSTQWDTTIDGGKRGCIRCFTLNPLVPPTPEERARNRKQQEEAVIELYRSIGAW